MADQPSTPAETTQRLTCGLRASNDPAPCVLPPTHKGRHQDAEGLTWDHGFKHGRPDVYEITWTSGHVETEQLNAVNHAAHVKLMADLTNKVVARFAEELADAASDDELRHLANRAEARYATDLGERMRELVDYARARRTVTAGIGGQP